MTTILTKLAKWCELDNAVSEAIVRAYSGDEIMQRKLRFANEGHQILAALITAVELCEEMREALERLLNAEVYYTGCIEEPLRESNDPAVVNAKQALAKAEDVL